MQGFRPERLGQLLAQKISSLIAEGRIKDSRVSSFTSITNVKVSKDLSFADVYVSDVRGTNIEKSTQGLINAAGFIQSQIGEVMHLRKIPKLRFHADTSIGDSFELIQKIDKLVNADSNELPQADTE